MKELDYPSLDSHLIVGVEAATMLNVFVSLHNNTAKLFENENKDFDGIIKASNETLSLLSGLSLTKTKKLVTKLTGRLKGLQLVKPIKITGCKSNNYKINPNELEKLNTKAESIKLKWLRGYDKNKWFEEMTTQQIYSQLSNELLHRYIEKKRNGL